MTFFFLLNPKVSGQLSGKPVYVVKGKKEKKLTKKAAKKLDLQVSQAVEAKDSYSEELQKSLLEYQALVAAIEALEARLKEAQAREAAEKELKLYLAQQAELERQKQILARLILEMEEEEYLTILLMMDD